MKNENITDKRIKELNIPNIPYLIPDGKNETKSYLNYYLDCGEISIGIFYCKNKKEVDIILKKDKKMWCNIKRKNIISKKEFKRISFQENEYNELIKFFNNDFEKFIN